LQEIDFLDLLVPELTTHGYSWEIKKKSPTGHGLAIIYKNNKLLKKEYRAINYDEINSFNSSFVLQETGNVAQMISFEIINTNRTIIVSNTHLYWRPEASAVKIKQACTLMGCLFDFKGDSDVPMLLCGDWNVMPQDILYRILTRKESVSEYELEHVFENVCDHGSVDQKAACEKVLEFYPQIPNLQSSYKVFYGEEPPYTTTSKDFTGVLDYIFFNGRMQVKNVEQIRDIGDIPNAQFPSDHVPVVATFSINE